MQDVVIILHGWGISGGKYTEIQRILQEKGYTVFSPDLPGFGNEKLRKDAMTVDDYVTFVKTFLEKKKLKKVIIIGHSFGSRVAAKFAATYPEKVSRLILTGAPLIKKPLSPKKQIITSLVKIGKALIPTSLQEYAKKGVYRALGEWDYYKAGNLKKTFQNVIAEDISPVLSKIPMKTLVLWGESDTFVPLAIGKEISREIPHAILKIVPGTHKLPYENPRLFAKEVLQFVSK